MVLHPRENWDPASRRRVYTRRDFLQRAAVLGIALPAMPTLLSACLERPPPEPVELFIGTPENPVQQPLFEDNPAIESGLPAEEGPLRVYNWADYINPESIPLAEEAIGADIEITTFFNLEESIQKLASGEVSYDVWFPTTDQLAKSVVGGLLQPLNHDYLPNLANIWPTLADPFYDLGSRYSVPYVMYATGLAWRTDKVDGSDFASMPNVWDVFWNDEFKGMTGLYDSFTDTLPMAMFRNGIADPVKVTDDQLRLTGDSLIELIDLMNILYTIDGAYVGIPEGRFGLHMAWAGDVVNSQYYFPEDGDPSVVRFLWPPKIQGSVVQGAIGNDAMTVLKGAKHPVLAHKFLNYMMDVDASLTNFSWLGYQPPLNDLDPETMVADEWIPETMVEAVIAEGDFNLPLAWVPTQLDLHTEERWQQQWDRVRSGG